MITGKNVRLRATERSDLSKFVQWLNDPEVYKHTSILTPYSEAQEELWFQDILKKPLEEQPLVIEAVQPAGWKTIGNTFFFNLDWHNRSSEIGIMIGEKSCWNMGFGCETMRLMLDYAFFTLNLNRVYLRVFETNPRALRSYIKAGFIEEGRLREGKFQDGKYINVILMSALRNEWRESEKR